LRYLLAHIHETMTILQLRKSTQQPRWMSWNETLRQGLSAPSRPDRGASTANR
jgi:hypothetical protein